MHGVIKRTQVLRMLKHRIGLFVHDGMSAWPPATARIPKSQVSCDLTLPFPHTSMTYWLATISAVVDSFSVDCSNFGPCRTLFAWLSQVAASYTA